MQQALISQIRVKCALHKASFTIQNQQLFGLYLLSHDLHKNESIMLQGEDRSILGKNIKSAFLYKEPSPD